MKTQAQRTDPIIDEIHRVRREIVKEAGGTLEALGKHLMESQKRHGDRVVKLPAKKIDE